MRVQGGHRPTLYKRPAALVPRWLSAYAEGGVRRVASQYQFAVFIVQKPAAGTFPAAGCFYNSGSSASRADKRESNVLHESALLSMPGRCTSGSGI